MDPIADMINSLKTAAKADRSLVSVPHSNVKMAIAKLLEEEGYLKSVVKAGKKNQPTIQVTLVYRDGVAKINGVKRLSKPSRRFYVDTRDLPLISKRRGTAVISTSRGLKTVRAALADKVGGELMFTIWS